MQPLASWLVARPQNAVVGLVATLFLPFAQIFSGAVMVLLTLHLASRRAVILAAVSAAIATVIGLLTKQPAQQLLAHALVTWLPVLLFAALLRGSRSLALTLQVSVIVAAVATLLIYVVLGDPTIFWREVLRQIEAVFTELGLLEQAGILSAQHDAIAEQMTALVVFSSWLMAVTVLLIGYALYRTLPDASGDLGRFCDLNLGRVLALALAIASILAAVIGAAWIQSLAFVLFATFWIQGLAIVHWLHAEKGLPTVMVVAVYALLPFLNVLTVAAMAIVGYVDAWIGFRQRMANGRGDP